jgi:hypothetical protein
MEDGWLLSKHSTLFKVLSKPRIELPVQSNPYYQISKVILSSPLTRNGCQSWKFLAQHLNASCCCPPFLAGNISLDVNTPSGSGNMYFANRQTDRNIVPYTLVAVMSSAYLRQRHMKKSID